MDIRVKSNNWERELERELKRAFAGILSDMAETIRHRFLEAVSQAQKVNTYKDQTTALRNSIGCLVYVKGKLLYSSFGDEAVGVVADGKHDRSGEGKTGGKDLAEEVAQEDLDKGIVAVLVAGMKYAKYVEDRGLDVLTGSTLRIEDDLNERLEVTIQDFLNRIKN